MERQICHIQKLMEIPMLKPDEVLHEVRNPFLLANEMRLTLW